MGRTLESPTAFPGKVNNRGHSAGANFIVDSLFIPDVGVPKDERPPADQLYPFERGFVAVGEIVDCDDVEPGVQQRDADMGPDVAGASNQPDQQRHLPYWPNRLPCNDCLGAGYDLQSRTRDNRSCDRASAAPPRRVVA
jgi:hypothetical protein